MTPCVKKTLKSKGFSMAVVRDDPRISVVIPSFNQGQCIEETLLSVSGQQCRNIAL